MTTDAANTEDGGTETAVAAPCSSVCSLPAPYYDRDGITIYHGDCLDILPGLPAESIRLLWSDPPYGHGNQNGDLQSARVRDGVKGARKADCEPIANDTPDAFRAVFANALDLAAPAMKRDCCCCCCCCCGGGPRPTFAWVAEQMDAAPWAFFHAVVWDKSDRGNGMGWRFRRNYEFVMVAHMVGGKLAWANDTKAVPNIMRMAPPLKRSHPNQKPVGLCTQFIGLHTQEGDIVLDPFMGSGTTLLAAKLEQRRAIGIELEEKYCEIAVKRLAQSVLF